MIPSARRSWKVPRKRTGGLVLALGLVLAWLASPACGDDSAGTGADGAVLQDSAIQNDAALPDAGSALDQAFVQTTAGPIQGVLDDGLAVFRGIPYAAPPVGSLRWRPPEPPIPWSETRAATAFGPICPQYAGSGPALPIGDFSADCPASCQGDYCCRGQEDCLTANVWTPASSPDDGLPVMVWIHGGGWNTGASSISLYDGAALARSGPVVVVSFNYRLGPLGFLAHPLLTAESPEAASGNYGLLDQVRLLQWVRDNARAFGGDPGNVTVFGESAGAGSICYLLASPLAAGLFHRAILESIGCTSEKGAQYLDQAPYGGDSAETLGLSAEATLGCDGAADRLACLRAKSAGEIFQTLQPSTGAFMGGTRYWPIVDGYLVTEAPLAAMRAGRENAADVIGGSNENEVGLWRPFSTIPLLGGTGITLEDADNSVDPSRFATTVTLLFGLAHRDEILALYPTPTTGSEAVLAYEQLVTDLVFTCPTRRYLRLLRQGGSAAYRYQFTRVQPGSYAETERYGAVHGAEVPYVFGTLSEAASVWQPMGPEDDALSASIQGYWLRFATTGDPNGAGALSWPAQTAGSDESLRLDAPITTEQGLRTAQCDAIDAFLSSATCDAAPPLPLACKN